MKKILISFSVVYVLLFIAFSEADAAEPEVFAEVLAVSYVRPGGDSGLSLWQQEEAGYPTRWDTHKTGFRIGAGYGPARLSYFDLGTYHIDAEASRDEFTVMACGCQIGETDWYYTTGSMRGFALTARGEWSGFFAEAGPTWTRQFFKIHRNNDYYFQERLWGLGYLVGIGYEARGITAGIYSYSSTVSGDFNQGIFPSGVDGAYVFSLGYTF